jgi:4-alpha-glucanotransferase
VEIIAEDLGLLTPQAAALRDHFGFPGMRLLHFAFGGEDGDRYHQPHSYPRNCVAYAGTHDNDTTVGWFEKLEREQRRRRKSDKTTTYDRVLRYLGTSGHQIHWDVIRLVQMSPANTAIITAQDILGLDNTARMNTPATTTKNWRWRLRPSQLTQHLAHRLRDLAETYERLPRT